MLPKIGNSASSSKSATMLFMLEVYFGNDVQAVRGAAQKSVHTAEGAGAVLSRMGSDT